MPFESKETLQRDINGYIESIDNFLDLLRAFKDPATILTACGPLALSGHYDDFLSNVSPGYLYVKERFTEVIDIAFPSSLLNPSKFHDMKGFFHLAQTLAHCINGLRRPLANSRVTKDHCVPNQTVLWLEWYTPAMIRRLGSGSITLQGLEATGRRVAAEQLLRLYNYLVALIEAMDDLKKKSGAELQAIGDVFGRAKTEALASAAEADNALLAQYATFLNIPETSSPEEFKKAYRRLAVIYHPDKGGDQEKFNELDKLSKQCDAILKARGAA